MRRPSAVVSQAPSPLTISAMHRLQRVLRERVPDRRGIATVMSERPRRKIRDAGSCVERRAQRSRRQRIEMRQAAEPTHAAHLGNVRSDSRLLVADKGDAEQRNVAALQRLDRQQAVIDGSEPGAGAQHDRDAASGRRRRCRKLRASAAPCSPPAPSMTSGRGRCVGQSPARSDRCRCRRARRRDAARPASSADRPPAERDRRTARRGAAPSRASVSSSRPACTGFQ